MEESAIREGFENLQPGSDYDNLYHSALCRQRADWLVGLNGTRLFTVEKLNDASRKDNVVTFEQLGVDRLFVDESHFYKNLFLYTKMRNVAGIAQTEAQKSSDMFAKCQYLDDVICCEL